MGARGKTLGGPEPCTIQASFRRSATTGAKHHKVLGNTHTRVNTTHTCQNWDFEFCSRGLPQQIQNQDCGSTTISKLQVLSKLLKMCASNVFQKHLCESPEQHWCGERPVKPVPSSLVAGIVPVSSEAVLPVRSEKQYNQDRHLYHAVY